MPAKPRKRTVTDPLIMERHPSNIWVSMILNIKEMFERNEQVIGKRLSNRLSISNGSTYPVIHAMEKAGILNSEMRISPERGHLIRIYTPGARWNEAIDMAEKHTTELQEVQPKKTRRQEMRQEADPNNSGATDAAQTEAEEAIQELLEALMEQTYQNVDEWPRNPPIQVKNGKLWIRDRMTYKNAPSRRVALSILRELRHVLGDAIVDIAQSGEHERELRALIGALERVSEEIALLAPLQIAREH